MIEQLLFIANSASREGDPFSFVYFLSLFFFLFFVFCFLFFGVRREA